MTSSRNQKQGSTTPDGGVNPTPRVKNSLFQIFYKKRIYSGVQHPPPWGRVSSFLSKKIYFDSLSLEATGKAQKSDMDTVGVHITYGVFAHMYVYVSLYIYK